MKCYKVAVVGAGSWGTSLALALNKKGHRVHLWMRRGDQLKEILDTGINGQYLPQIKIPHGINLTNDIFQAIKDADIILLTIPTQQVRNIVRVIKPSLESKQIILNAAKGIEENTHLRISQILKEEIPTQPYAIISGPSHAEELARDIPTTVVVASQNRCIAEFVQDIFNSTSLRVYTNPDLVGVELGGALKNVIAFGAGITDGLGYGDNAKAALMTRGISEIARLGRVMGANISTFAGLSGIGDLIVTCTSMHSRNRRAGILIGQGKSLQETLEEVGMVVEGITTTKVVYEMAHKYKVDMPITKEIYGVLYKGTNPRDAVTNLMTRSTKNEMEEIVDINHIDW